ncbi:hypothetical protein EII17_00945 [Clostridiales bacterium COT073_COT-073]|nr:hypothetical protein EII17_00945 [Clostridiales bacterium COT073_COT-073]
MTDFKIPSFFILFLTFLFLWTYNSRKQQKKYQAEKDAFWEKEKESLVVRKKEIPANLYYQPNIHPLHFPKLELDPATAAKYEKLTKQLINSADLPMLNLNNLSNTEIRLNFGTANQPVITQAEENYEAFLGFLYEYALLMQSQDCIEEAISAMEEAIRLNSDISKHFFLLGDLYQTVNHSVGIQKLIILAEDLPIVSKEKTIRYLQQLLT